VEVGVGLLGYGTVGAAVDRLLSDNADDIERATGLRLKVVRALVRDVDKERMHLAADGVLTTDFSTIRDDPEIGVVAELMGGIEPAREHVLALLARRQARRSPRTSSSSRSTARSCSPPLRRRGSSCASRRACAPRSRSSRCSARRSSSPGCTACSGS
jgi:hypothetical protein